MFSAELGILLFRVCFLAPKYDDSERWREMNIALHDNQTRDVHVFTPSRLTDMRKLMLAKEQQLLWVFVEGHPAWLFKSCSGQTPFIYVFKLLRLTDTERLIVEGEHLSPPALQYV